MNIINFFREACWKIRNCACIDSILCLVLKYIFSPFWRYGKKAVPHILWPVQKWERVFLVSCIAVSLDPLFMYIPIVDEKNKCLSMDKKLRNLVLIFRTIYDFLLLAHMIALVLDRVETDYEIPDQLGAKPGSHEEFDSDIVDVSDKWFFVSSLIVTSLAVLPIPQVAILEGFFRLGSSDFSITRKFLNMSFVLQYLPRVSLIYLSRSKFSMDAKWAGPAFNLFLYILASHTLGALWYFFAIERETTCWYSACEKTAGCIPSAYKCGVNVNASARNITMLNELCPITLPNSTKFDFGIFVKVLQSGNTGPVDFPTKIFYTLWWGLKNLSNFGTNLDTSNYLWENCFAILICVIGLLLFLYLIGNMQVFMQSTTTNALEYEKLRQKKITENKGEIVKWMKVKRFDDGKMKKFKEAIRECKVLDRKPKLEIDVKYFLNDVAFSNSIKQDILEHLGLTVLRKVPLFSKIPDENLKDLCQHMIPVTYNTGVAIKKENEPLDQMILIIGGEVEFVGTVTAGPSNARRENTYFGQLIERWVAFNLLNRSFCDPLPNLPQGFIKSCNFKVEGLALDAWKILRFAEGKVVEGKVIGGIDVNSQHLKILASQHMSTVHEIEEGPSIPSVWQPPAAGWVKLNCSYIWNSKTNRAGFGCVLRNDQGAFLEAATDGSNNHHYFDEFHVGASCILNLLKFGVQLLKAGRQIIVESNDKPLIDFLQKGRPLLSDVRVRNILRPVLEDILTEVAKLKGYKFVQCKTQANGAAILVAQYASDCGVSELKTWKEDEIPTLRDALEKDCPLRVQESADQNASIKRGSSTSAAAVLGTKDTVVDIKEK